MNIACNLAAFDTAERIRYGHLITCVRAALISRKEVTGGFVFELGDQEVTSDEIGEWIKLERRCCPLLVIEFSESSDARRILTMTGPEGVSQLIADEFPTAR